MAKPVNTSSGQSGSFDSNITEDVNGFHKGPNQWTQARNAVTNTIVGDLLELSNEASNYLCSAIPYTIIGNIHLGADEWAIYSTNNIDSEIGLFKEDDCSYETIVNDECLGFNKNNLIKGVGRTTFDCGRQAYWDDGNQPSRLLNLDDVPWIQEPDPNNTDPDCNVTIDTNKLDCDKIRLAPIIKDLAFRVTTGQSSGQLINGSYYVVGAYLINGVKVTDYSLPSNVQGLFTHSNIASSLDIFIEEADQEYDEFELILIQFANFNTVARKIGVYSTRQSKISIDQIDESLPTIDVSLILIQNPVFDKTDATFRNGQYLVRTGPTEKFDFNYQPLANQIKTSWVSVEYDSDYYRKGGTETSYMRDEIYSFFIRWKYNTGDRSKSYHIPGRFGKASDFNFVSGDDVVDSDITDIQGNLIIPQPQEWNVYNTATVDPLYPGINTILPDGGKILGGGEMGYWESSEFYDDDKPQIWNANTGNVAYDLCGKNIRHHRFPDNATDTSPDMITNHYDPINGQKIRVMGVQFDNIQAPLDNNGIPLTNVVGYEILRGSREGNKSVLAKGMINNLREYRTTDKEATKTFLYPNYPYNPTAVNPNFEGSNGTKVVDHFLSGQATEYNGHVKGDNTSLFNNAQGALNDWNAYLEDDSPLGANQLNYPEGNNIMKDMVTFHSPETNFRDPFLSAKEIKVYGELHGTMVGKHQFPKDHPRHKFISNTAFFVSALIGVGYAMLSTEGKKSTSHSAPKTDFGGTYAQIGVATGTTGLIGPSAPQAVLQTVANAGASIANKAINLTLKHSMLSMLMSVVGLDSNKVRDTALNTSGNIAGAIGGSGGQTSFGREDSAWGSTPGILRAIQGIPAFLSYWGEGIDKMLNIIYAFTPYRQYALQQTSHCYYDRFARPDIGQIRRGITDQNYLNPELQDFAQDFRINNIFRSRTVALKLEKGLNVPYQLIDNSQALFSDIFDRDTDSEEWKDDESINTEFQRNASSHYVAIKQRLDNQYGQIASITQVPVSTDSTPLNTGTSEILFNGDTYIGRYTEKNTMFFFYDWLKGQPDGSEFDYRLRKMITHPRFWMNSNKFDVGEFVQSLGTVFDTNDAAPQDFDPFMLQEGVNSPDSLNYNPNNPTAACDCDHTLPNQTWGVAPNDFISKCLFSQTDLNEICDLQEEVFQLDLYLEFLKDCACFVNTSDETLGPPPTTTYDACNDGSVTNPVSDSNYDDCNNTYTDGCASCPNLSGLLGTNSFAAAKYLYEQRGKWNTEIRRTERKLGKKQKKLDKKINNLYDDYLDGLDGDQEGFFQDLTDNIITPSDKFAFDMRKPSRFRLGIKEAFMYLFNSGVRDFYCETEINIDYRDWGNVDEERHYDYESYTNLRDLFSTENIKVGNYYKYDYSLSISKLFNNFISWGSVQDIAYDPFIAETCFRYRPKRLIYSLPQFEEDKKDNWRAFLPLNYKDFTSKTTAIKPIGKNGAMILFENESPIQFLGVDQLQTDAGTKITIGDGGLFSQPLQNLVNAEYPHEYGSCQNRLAIANTPVGMFYMSQNQGKIFQVTGNGLQEISNQGMKWWFAKYLPYQLIKDDNAFIDNPFELLDNPVVGIGCQVIFDNKNQIVFFCKKDWVIRTDIADTVTYVEGTVFKVGPGEIPVELGDPNYFKPASWTVSWDPKTNGGKGGWIGYHDWHPDLVLPSKKTYMTTKDNGMWIHADSCESYCNFYGVDYPFEVEFSPIATQVNTLRNIMYFMEVYKYADNCFDRFHVLDFNFDEAIVYNSEQCSGLLKLNLTPKNDPITANNYPIINPTNIDILFSKEEQKYRFNQFWDMTDDRGEFNLAAERTIFDTEANGYIKNLNPNNLNYNKNALERKKFRHYKNTVLLRRLISGDKNMIIALAAQMNLTSPR